MLKNSFKFFGALLILVAIGVTALVVVRYVEYRNDLNSDTAQKQKPDEIVITNLSTGEKLVENKTLGFQTKIPIGLEINKYPTNYHLKAFSPENAKTEVIYQVDFLNNTELLPLIEWVKKYRGDIQSKEIIIGNMHGLSYSRPVLVTDEEIPLENSEEFLALLPNKDTIIQLSCSATGYSYQEKLAECKKEINTFILSK